MEPGVQQVFEAIVAEMVKLCPWMTEEDVGLWREVLLCHFRIVALEEVDLLSMAEALLALAEHAQAVGDARRAWAFEQWYAWTCASMQGEEYHWPELPHELEAMP